MDPRLKPINALISLCRRDDGWLSTLSENDYKLQRLELPVKEPETVVLDGVAMHDERAHLLAVECKSGANIDADQARRLARVQAAAIIEAGAIDIRSGQRPTLDTCYLGLEEYEASLARGLEEAKVEHPLLVVGSSTIRLARGRFRCPLLNEAFGAPVEAPGPPPVAVPVDEHSSSEEFFALLRTAVVASMSRRDDPVAIPRIAEQLVGFLPLMGHRHRMRLIRKFEEAARALADELPEYFEVVERRGSQQEMVMRILKNPEDFDARGRTQGYQAFARHARTAPARKPREAPGQLRIEDLMDEVSDLSDTHDRDDPHGEPT